ncbi:MULTISPECIES: transposase zinc-binding domain-containing protein [unclassified Colwellia]|uniref:transposase zinc-binding domain-containing protein n=1 Tax=unclassified Colwellia TaxID=196834 RepID=UPI0038560AD3
MPEQKCQDILHLFRLIGRSGSRQLHLFLLVVCCDFKHEKLGAFSCKRRGLCPNCGARRIAESLALLVDDVLGGYPVRQWVLSIPIPPRLLLARYPSELNKVMQIIHRAIPTHIANKAGFTNKQAKTGAVTLLFLRGSCSWFNLRDRVSGVRVNSIALKVYSAPTYFALK